MKTCCMVDAGTIIHAVYGRHHSKLARKYAQMEKQNGLLAELDKSDL